MDEPGLSSSARRFRRPAPEEAEAFNLLELILQLPVPEPGPADGELRALFEADQADRADEDHLPDDLAARDRRRREAVLNRLRSRTVHTAADFYHAAMVLQHGPLADHNHLGFELARRAADAEHPGARWLAAAAMDRWLMRKGQPQRFGTQYVDDGAGWVLYPVDPATTDEDRAAWNVPPLADA